MTMGIGWSPSSLPPASTPAPDFWSQADRIGQGPPLTPATWPAATPSVGLIEPSTVPEAAPVVPVCAIQDVEDGADSQIDDHAFWPAQYSVGFGAEFAA